MSSIIEKRYKKYFVFYQCFLKFKRYKRKFSQKKKDIKEKSGEKRIKIFNSKREKKKKKKEVLPFKSV